MHLPRTLTPIVFVLSLLFWPALVPADSQAGAKASTLGDYATALKEWRPLAEQGDMESQFRMGFLYDNGYGVPQDYGAAARWYRLAAEQGHDLAQRRLGLLHEQGLGVPQDYGEAARWYRLAAEQGNALAQVSMGFMYDKGQGVLQDYVQAHMWVTLAGAQGHVGAAKARRIIEKKMTPEQIAAAQWLAREWLAIHQK